MIKMDPWTQIDPRNKNECDNLNCRNCRYYQHNQERTDCYKYELYHKPLNTLK